MTRAAGSDPAVTHAMRVMGRQGAGPRRRALVGLALAVMGVHGLVLQSSPLGFGPDNRQAETVRPLLTRTVAPPPAALPAAPPAAAPKPSTSRPVLKPKRPVAPESIAPPAIESVANPSSEQPLPEASAASEAADAALVNADTAPPPPPPAVTPPQEAVTAVTAVSLPGNVSLAYKMTGSAKGLTYHANAELNWRRAGSLYDATMRVSALFIGARSMASTGVVGADGLSPIRFSDKSRTELAAHFEPDKGQITFSANTPTAPWIKGAQDRVSVFIQLGGMLAGNPGAFPVGTTVSLYTAGPRDADTWVFLVEAEETLSLPAGEMATLKLTRQPRREFDQKVEIWYAPSLDYLPVRNKITQHNGDFVDQQLSTVNRPPPG